MDDFFEFQVPTGVVAGQRALATLGEEVAGLEIGRALTHAVEAYLSNHRDPSLMPWRYRRGASLALSSPMRGVEGLASADGSLAANPRWPEFGDLRLLAQDAM